MNNLKKIPAKQLEKFSNIFTQLGLVLVLFVVYISLEHKTEEKTIAALNARDLNIIYIEPEQQIIIRKEAKAQPKVTTKPMQVFILEEIVKGDNDIIETIIDMPKEAILEVNIDEVTEIIEPEEAVPETVPFINIEDAPVFKGCEGLSKEENKRCFDKKMKEFVQRNFNTSLANELGLYSGIHKIQTQFLIDDKGNVVDIKIRAPHKQLENEAARLIKKLPKFTPGKQRNRPVKVRYVLPIAFRVE
ncbi:energy transducer TonB [Polaribacter sp. IC073]|uniref:energy transducer TonB n=1 Tax=Polaribacter sp. IC073 TaxID=2508540 RepID=UPI0011BDC524|nr:energy transducer TonB [Polaribacter sp. IC073]TXD49868.1 hypothetical protein ES045_01420 [Polaribacter sp. IC073]